MFEALDAIFFWGLIKLDDWSSIFGGVMVFIFPLQLSRNSKPTQSGN
jgi:hypothetical protein